MKTKDPIVQEIRSTRGKLFDACEEDLDKLLDRYHEEEKRHQDRLVKSKEKLQRQKPKPGAA